MNHIQFLTPPIETVFTEAIWQKKVMVDVLRLDKIHPTVSGNKWYKLKEYLKQAKQLNKKTIVTFGGAFSNHIHATAAVCHAYGFKSVGIIRGEKPAVLSPTLSDASAWGMELFFLPRTAYKTKEIPPEIAEKYKDIYLIAEGGYGTEGMRGAEEILKIDDLFSYTHIIAAVGTGTTLAGLVKAAKPHQQVIGISVMKNNYQLESDIQKLTGTDVSFSINHDFAFGGYAKSTPALIEFMNDWYKATGIPTDFVYTAKLFYAANKLVQQSFFPEGSKLLIIHSGGLQGNRSLKKGTLIF